MQATVQAIVGYYTGVAIFPAVHAAAMPGWINVIPNAHILQLSSILRNSSSPTPTILPRIHSLCDKLVATL